MRQRIKPLKKYLQALKSHQVIAKRLYLYQVKIALDKLNTIQLQWLIWLSVSIIIFISLLPMDGLIQSAVYTFINTGFYALVIYGNISLLYPRLYLHGHRLVYALAVVALLLAAGAGRGFLSWYVYYKYFAPKSVPFTFNIILNFFVAAILIYILSFIFRIALAYFSLKKHTEDIMLQKSKAELNLLKSQVQPHFLFNTLNNIYYEAYLESPKTALLIERLAEIMRYLVDDSPKEKVMLDKEVQFLENYIALEQIRLLHGAEVDFIKQYDPGLLLPPMLLITFTENIFKHGIDKSSTTNKVQIKLIQQDGFLHFTTFNNFAPKKPASAKGSGLDNLKQRLALLYDSNFEMSIIPAENTFTAYFKIPLS